MGAEQLVDVPLWVDETETRSDATVTITDARWSEAGVTVRQIDYWTRNGILNAVGPATPGSGYARGWPLSEVQVAARLRRLLDAGLVLQVAAKAARADDRHEIAPGIWIEVTR